MKVAFIGTHGVGKTTLCYELAARLKKRGLDSDIVKETARACPLPINQDTNLYAQLWILHTQIAREVELEARHRVVVCDRSVLDNYSYLAHAAGPQPAVARLVKDWIHTYGLLFRVPNRHSVQQDGVRDTDPDFQRAIDQRILLLLADWKIPYHDLDGTPRKRWIGIAEHAVLAKLGIDPGLAPDGETEAAAEPEAQLDLFE